MRRLILIAIAIFAVIYAAIPSHEPAVRVVVLQTLGQSAPKNGIPFFSESDFVHLIEKVSSTGGDIAFGTITDEDNPLTRLSLNGSKNAYQKQRRMAKLNVFRHQIIQKLSFRTLHDHINLTAAVNRANTFLNETHSTRQYLIIISDGDNTANLPTIAKASVYIVGATGHEPGISNARNFESVAAAIDAITYDSNNEE